MAARPLLLLLTCLTLCAASATASPAGAATVTKDTTTSFITFTAGDAEANRLTITDDGDDYVFTDPAGVVPGPGCTDDAGGDPDVAECPIAGPGTSVVVVELGDLADEVTPADVHVVGFLIRGGDGDDTLRGSSGTATSTLEGGPGLDAYEVPGPAYDGISYSDKTAPLSASLDDLPNDPDGENVPSTADAIGGGSGDDTVTGSDGSEYVAGGAGDDTVRGLAGNDILQGDAGDDTVEGGDGTDTLSADAGADSLSGGEGFDRAEIRVSDYATGQPRDASGTLDDTRNDGQEAETDHVRGDVEDLTAVSFGGLGRASLVGDEHFNVLTGANGPDTIEGGLGGDLLSGAGGDDTIRARDGIADRIDCGAGEDVAEVDPADRLLRCERADVGSVLLPSDDRPPVVAFTTPAENARLRATGATVGVEASDDRTIARVLLVDDGRVVGTDTEAPYAFGYAPTGDDVGRNTLVALAVDGAEQTATAIRPLSVARFGARLTRRVTPGRDRTYPFRFTTTGRVRPPVAVTAAQGCRSGRVAVQVKSGRRTISTRRARLARDCSFRSRVTFRERERLGRGRLRVVVRFTGNAVLAPRTARAVAVRAAT